MTKSEFQTRFEAFQLAVITATDHYLIIRDQYEFFDKKERAKIELWNERSEKLTRQYRKQKPSEYIGILTDCLHEQMDEVVKAIDGLKQKALEEYVREKISKKVNK